MEAGVVFCLFVLFFLDSVLFCCVLAYGEVHCILSFVCLMSVSTINKISWKKRNKKIELDTEFFQDTSPNFSLKLK